MSAKIENDNNDYLKISGITISGLYGVYNHKIEITNNGITIIHGPNGVGKTAVLRCIKYFFDKNFSELENIPFERMDIRFHNDTSYSITKPEIIDGNSITDVAFSQHKLEIATERNGKKQIINFPVFSDEMLKLADVIASHNRGLTKISPGLWHDQKNNKIIGASVLLNQFLKRDKKKSPYSFPENPDAPIPDLAVKLIDTNRLSRIEKDTSVEKFVISTVVDCANDLINQIKLATAAYGKRSQELDQSFPHRLIEGVHEKFSREELGSRLKLLEEKQKELGAIGLLESISGPLLPTSIASLSDPKLEAISLFIQDGEQKLEELSAIAKKCNILLAIFEKKFRNKKIKINREKGLCAIDVNGKPLDLTSLSSGEQHEIVLNYELLFKTKAGTLVLIDEPEISLHVNWQRSFVSDLMEMAQVVGFESIIATHSPFIVGDHLDLLCSLDLGPEQ